MKKYLILVLALLMLTTNVLAADHVIISEVIYDPMNTESGGEVIELYNPTNQTIEISNYVIKTETSATDATIPVNTFLDPGHFYLIADTGWSTSKDNPDYPDADHEEAISLTNSNAGIALLNGNTTIDALGWGNTSLIDPGLFLGTPAQHVSAGNSLKRFNLSIDNQNNSLDFIESTPDLKNSSYQETQTQEEQFQITATVSNTPPKILSISISPDEFPEQGVQILPSPGNNKTLTIEITAEDQDSYTDLSLVNLTLISPLAETTYSVTEKTNTSATKAIFTKNIELSFFDIPGRYYLNATLFDNSSDKDTKQENFSYLALIAFELENNLLDFIDVIPGNNHSILGDKDFATPLNPTIKNIGNVNLTFGLFGTDLEGADSNISVSNIKYSFDNNFTSSLSDILSTTLTFSPVNLIYGGNSLIEFALKLFVPENTPKGTYLGSISLVGMQE